MRYFILSFVFLICGASPLVAQKTTLPSFTGDFLDLPAPPPRGDIPRKLPIPATLPTPGSKPGQPPADDAPSEEFFNFWFQVSRSYQPLRYSPKPSERAVERIIEMCKENPGSVALFLNILPNDTSTAETVKALFDEMGEEPVDFYGLQRTKEWLTFNSPYFVDELIKKVEKVADKDEYVLNQNELLALARVDWDRAKPYLERLVDDKQQPVSSTLAKWAYYARALRENDENDITKYRRLLQDVVENREILPGARDLALDALVKEADWNGRDDWYVSLLSDETLYDLKVNGRSFTGLTTLLLYSPPEKYAKMMTSLMDSKNSAVRQAAAKNLVALLDHNNEDAVRALLPWLADPKWLPAVPNARQRLIVAAGELKIPEALNPVISIVMNEPELRYAAVRALVSYADPRAVPALKIGWANETAQYQKGIYIDAIDKCGGFTADEKVAGLEAYLAMTATPEGMQSFSLKMYAGGIDGEPLSLEVMLGHSMTNRTDPGEDVAARALVRLKILRQKQPLIADALAAVMSRWNNRTMFVERLRQLKAGEADHLTVLQIIQTQDQILEKAPNELASVRSSQGFPRGIAYCISGDDADLAGIVRQPDVDAAIAALGCARFTQAKLPVSEVGALMASANKLLALAAERYLETNDSLAARTLILAKYPGQARILGARQGFVQPSGKVNAMDPDLSVFVNPQSRFTAASFTRREKIYQDEIRADVDLLAVFGLIPDSDEGHKIVRVYRDRVVYTDYEDTARYRERVLTKKEYEDFYRLIIDEKVDTTGPQLQLYRETVPVEFVMFGKDGGRRVFFVSDPSDKTLLGKLYKGFQNLDNGEMTLRYRVGQKIKGLEVLIADKNFEVIDVWKNGPDMRVLIADIERQKEIKANLDAEFEAENKVELEDDDYEGQQQRRESQRRRRDAVDQDHLSWRFFAGGKLGDQIAQPTDLPILRDGTEIPIPSSFDSSTPSWKVRAGSSEIRTPERWSGEPGLYKLTRDAAPVTLADGEILEPRTTPDGEWVFFSKPSNMDNSMTVVRMNLRTGKEMPVAVPPAEAAIAIAFVDSHGKMLVTRMAARRWNGEEEETEVEVAATKKPTRATSEAARKAADLRPAKPEYFLVNAATGAAEPVTGEFRPLFHESYRRLQKTSQPNEFWAAIYDEKTKTTAVGRFNSRTFSFTKTTDLPDIELDSMDIWVDERENKVYFVYQTHLLAAPLGASPEK